ncbi:MAG: NAD(+)/NADH kinase [Myxococcota bacterium]|nr:NAD(+)/NADH kinase [Myxococcota bacterium]
MLELRRIGLFLRDDDQSYPVLGLEKVLQRAGIELVNDAWRRPAKNLDLIIALGGDGTVLRALTAYPNVPVLAINFGNVGFLTQSDREDFDRVLVRLLSDDYFIEERLTLDITFAGQTYRSINEMVLKGVSHMVEVDIDVNDRRVHTPRGDGVIIGTPTGSTAYLLSTGAPLVVPDVDCIIVKPLNEYSFSSRTIILPGNAHIRLKLNSQRETDVRFSVDGLQPIPLSDRAELTISRSAQPARLVCFESDYFFRNLRERLRW